ncbi:MAG: PAS domain S-box protein, partial [Gammaproteobacteria bacterium]|nr:PAS domain S-box protein [Gammaproteobacteria bacterium]
AKPFDVEEVKARIRIHLRMVEADRFEKEIGIRRLVETQYFQQLESLNAAVVHVDKSGKVVYANSKACDLFEYKKDDLIGESVELLMPEQFRNKHVRHRRSYLVSPGSRGMGASIQVSGLKKSGLLFPVDINISSLYTKDGIIVSAEIKDLTEQKRIEADLDQQQSIFEAVFQNIPDALFIFDKDRQIIMATPSVSNMFGFRSDYFVGNNLLSLCADEESYEQMSQFVFDSESKATLEAPFVRFSRDDKKIFSGEVVSSVIIDGEKQKIGYIVLVRDITERQKYNEEKSKLHAQFLQSQKMEALGQLTGGIAHDFNNMLASIIGYTELAQQYVSEADGDMFRYLEEVSSAGFRARDLVSQMQMFSRNANDVNKEILNLKIIVAETVKLLRPILTSSVSVDMIISDAVPLIKADSGKIQQVIMNLCINARDAMQGQGHIGISLVRRIVKKTVCDSCHSSFEGEYAKLSVRDDGSGIDGHILNRLFEPFFTTKDVGKGTGMGLAMVHGITHEHEGHIVVNSNKNEGTTFNLYFPVTSELVIEKGSDNRIAQNKNIGSNKKIVVIDDEDAVARFLLALLENYGFDVVVFNDSNKAFDYLSAGTCDVDLVITDQIMPEMSGIELAKKILKIKPEMEFILSTGYSDTVDEKLVKLFGVNGFLTKPYKSDVLIDTVCKILTKRNSGVAV